MAVTVANIQARTEFASTDARTIEQSIADAEMLVNRAAYATDAESDFAVKMKAMHLIAMGPHGEPLRFKKSDPDGCTTTYERTFRQIRISARVQGPVVVT